jgi:tryptophanyl-tRNA synthetase
MGNTVDLRDSEQETTDKIKAAKTDSEAAVGYDPAHRPEVSNLVLIYALCKGLSPQDALASLGSVNNSTFKPLLATALNEHLAPVRARCRELEANPARVEEVLAEGLKRASRKAKATMRAVRKAMQIDY